MGTKNSLRALKLNVDTRPKLFARACLKFKLASGRIEQQIKNVIAANITEKTKREGILDIDDMATATTKEQRNAKIKGNIVFLSNSSRGFFAKGHHQQCSAFLRYRIAYRARAGFQALRALTDWSPSNTLLFDQICALLQQCKSPK